jgi:hypothetical protein
MRDLGVYKLCTEDTENNRECDVSYTCVYVISRESIWRYCEG